MGNNISIFTDIAAIGSYVSELGDVYYEKSIGTARFMKTLRGRHKDGYVVIKLFIKPESGINLAKQVEKIKEERTLLQSVPNAFYFQRVMETDRAAYLVRQYLYSSLYDRISIRPFLTTIEKKWIAYQIIRGIADSHAKGVYHGDIKTENVLITSWNWAYLVDYAFYKPTYLPENNPADYSYFFDTSYRRTCYIAPERFYKSGTEIDQRMKKVIQGNYKSELTPEMDVFSVGCVIAELFLESTPLFTLSQLFKYRSGEYNPNASLEQIEDKNIRDMIKHMIQVDPNKRLSAEDYLSEWHSKAFPDYFYSFLYPYMSSLNAKIDYQRQKQNDDPTILSALCSAYPSFNNRKMTDADEKIERVFYDFEKIIDFISKPNDQMLEQNDEGSLIVLSFICSLVRNTLYPSSKLKALDIFLALAGRLPDDVKLDRLVPYLIVLLTDESALVRANAIKTLTQVLSMVESISPINARIFPEYIIPSIRPFSTDPYVLVRATYASCIASLAETALRFLEMTQLLKTDNVYPLQDTDSEDLDFESAYDSSLQDLHAVIQEQATILLIDPESSVKRALLTNITCLCVFFGRQKANDVLLSHMITYLNGKDWMLRSAFFESIKGVGTFVGARSLEEYILPLMVQSLTDAEEFVVEKVLNSLTSLADLGLFQKMMLWELIGIIWPLMCHPNVWIRFGAVGFIASTSKHLPKTDLWCIVYPLLRRFLRSDIADIDEQSLLENMATPVSRQVYEQAIVWATKATPSSNFWKKQSSKPVKDNPKAPRASSLREQGPLFDNYPTLDHLENSREDEFYFEKLRGYGMTLDDEEKLRYMREYIYKVSITKMSRPKTADEHSLKGEVLLKNLNVTPMTVFLPEKPRTPSKSKQDDTMVVISDKHKVQPCYAHLQNLLHKIAKEAFPPHIPEFTGDAAVMKRVKKLVNSSMSPSSTLYNWKPVGTLVAHFTEHTAAINQLAISFDNLLFASCSDDGSVRIWDCSRLERNVTNRSRATYSQQGGHIKCMTFIQQTHSIASASDNGSIHIFRVDIKNAGSALKYGKCITVREYQLVDEYATILKHFTSNASNTMAGSKSILLFATTKNTIYALDLLTMEIIWKLQNSKSHGVITSIVVDPKYTWLLVGTMRGILTLYDLRFQIMLKSWMHPSKSCISDMTLTPDGRDSSHEKMLVRIAAGRYEVSIWDIEFLQCLEVFAVKPGDEKTTGVILEAYKALEPPSDKEILVNSFTNNESNLAENSIRTVAAPAGHHFMITGGSDRKIRFWDTARVDNSCVVLGLDIDEPKPRYSTNTFENMKFHFEFTHSNRNLNTANLGSRTGFNTSTTQSGNNNAIVQQQYLMRNHTDAITDIILTEIPYPMIISGDRDGVIKIVS